MQQFCEKRRAKPTEPCHVPDMTYGTSQRQQRWASHSWARCPNETIGLSSELCCWGPQNSLHKMIKEAKKNKFLSWLFTIPQLLRKSGAGRQHSPVVPVPPLWPLKLFPSIPVTKALALAFSQLASPRRVLGPPKHQLGASTLTPPKKRGVKEINGCSTEDCYRPLLHPGISPWEVA